MLRNIAGIMADEEPKTSTSVSGNYNSTTLSSLSAFNTSLLSGLDEFTLMFWVYLDPANPSSFTVVPYTENKSPSTVINPVTFRNNNIEVKILNSGGGSTLTLFSTPPTVGEFFHCAVSGSLSNSRIRLYINGVLESSSIMSYANATMDDAQLNNSECDIAQVNLYGVELTEAEVLEHYVYDDDLLFAGVLGFDAMTTGQKANMLYSSSLIEDVSFSGNEYSDKTGNGISLTPKPSLLGEQIYIYTNADDLPSAGPQIYNVNSATLVGPNDCFEGGNILSLVGNDFYFSGWFELDSVTVQSATTIISKVGSSGSREFIFNLDPTSVYFSYYNNNTNGTTLTFNTTVNANQSYHYVLNRNGNDLELYLDGVLVDTQDCTGMSPSATTQRFLIYGRDLLGSLEASEGSLAFVGAKIGASITQVQVDELYGNGIPPCYDDITTPFDEFWNLCNYNGNAGTETDSQTGSGNNLSPINNVTYTDQGLQVECGGSPPANDKFPYTFPFNLG